MWFEQRQTQFEINGKPLKSVRFISEEATPELPCSNAYGNLLSAYMVDPHIAIAGLQQPIGCLCTKWIKMVCDLKTFDLEWCIKKLIHWKEARFFLFQSTTMSNFGRGPWRTKKTKQSEGSFPLTGKRRSLRIKNLAQNLTFESSLAHPTDNIFSRNQVWNLNLPWLIAQRTSPFSLLSFRCKMAKFPSPCLWPTGRGTTL